MNKSLEKVYHALELQRDTLLKEIQGLPVNLLVKKPAISQWSILEILTHLYTSEKLSIGYIKKKSQGIHQLKNAGLQQSLMLPILKISQRLPLKFKAPKVVVENTPAAMPMETLLEQWNLLRLELKSHLEHVADGHVHKLVYKHPVAGRLSVTQAMLFFAEHINHHKAQIKRTLKSLNKS